MSESRRFESRRILVTGATRGIGRVMVARFAGLGHSIAACGRTAEALVELAEEIGEGHYLESVDVTDAAGIDGWAKRLNSSGWVPDLLINNAAVINRSVPLWQQSEEEIAQVIDINIKGTINVIRAFLPAMIDAGRGVVVNVSSGWGHSTSANVAPYCASKFAIEGLTRALAHELPPGLAAVPLSPGVIHTEMLETVWGEDAAVHWKPQAWADVAVPYILALGPKDNGRSQRIPER